MKKPKEPKNAAKKSYDRSRDAFYNTETLEWIEPVCKDKTCIFCKNRPPKFEPYANT